MRSTSLVDGNVGAIVELNCNTDFVAKGSDFTGAASPSITKLVAANGDADVAALPFEGSTVGETLQQLAGKLGENVDARPRRALRVRRPPRRLPAQPERPRHHRRCSSRSAASTRRTTQAREVAHEIALHISFAAPAYLTRDEVPADVIAREQAVIEEKSRNEGVPEAKLEGAVKGRLNALLQGRRAARAAVGEGPEGHASASWSRASAATPRSRGSPA